MSEVLRKKLGNSQVGRNEANILKPVVTVKVVVQLKECATSYPAVSICTGGTAKINFETSLNLKHAGKYANKLTMLSCFDLSDVNMAFYIYTALCKENSPYEC